MGDCFGRPFFIKPSKHPALKYDAGKQHKCGIGVYTKKSII